MEMRFELVTEYDEDATTIIDDMFFKMKSLLDANGYQYELRNSICVDSDPVPQKKQEPLNLVEILKYAPIGTLLWSPVIGDCELRGVNPDQVEGYPITCMGKSAGLDVTEQGLFLVHDSNMECILFPSRDQRDWSKFKIERKCDYSDGEMVWVRDNTTEPWQVAFHTGDYGVYGDLCYGNQAKDPIADNPDKHWQFIRKFADSPFEE